MTLAAIFLGLLLSGVPVAIVLGVSASAYIVLTDNTALFQSYMLQLFGATEHYGLLPKSDLKLFYQGLIQVAAAFHQHSHEKWAGVDKLLRRGKEKLEHFRPFTQGLDVEAFLTALQPWLDLAAARVGRAEPVTRIPDAPPRIDLETR